MKTLDRYIIRSFLMNYAALLVVLLLLFALVDLIVELDEFTDAAGQVAEAESIGWWAAFGVVMVDWYLPQFLLLWVYMAGVIAIGAMGFTFAYMVRNRELVAMTASGVSMYRVAAPMVLAATLMLALTVPAQEWLVPRLAYKLARDKSDVGRDTVESFPVYYLPDAPPAQEEDSGVGAGADSGDAAGPGNLVSARSFDAAKGELLGVTILERSAEGLATARITAERAVWEPADPANEVAGGAWRLLPIGTRVEAPDFDAGQRTVNVAEQRTYPTDLSPTLLLAQQAGSYARLLPVSQLQALRGSPAVSGKLRRDFTRIIWGRFSMLIVNVLLLVMAMPAFLVRVPVPMMLPAVKSAAVGLGGWGGAIACPLRPRRGSPWSCTCPPRYGCSRGWRRRGG